MAEFSIEGGDNVLHFPGHGFEQVGHLVKTLPPPGLFDFGTEMLHSQSLRQALAPGGIFILEKLPGSPFPKKMDWECVRLKKYGATEVAFLQPNTVDS